VHGLLGSQETVMLCKTAAFTVRAPQFAPVQDTLPKAALMVADPAATAVAFPFWSTVATFVWLLDQAGPNGAKGCVALGLT